MARLTDEARHPMALRVLHVITDLRTGGAEMQLLRLARASRGRGDPAFVGVVSLGNGGAIADRMEREGVRVWRLGAAGPFGLLRALRRLRALVRAERADVVVAWLYHAMVASALPGVTRRGVARIWNVRGTMPSRSDKRGTRFSALVARLLSGRADRVIYNSDAARRQHEAAGFAPGRGVTIPNGFEMPAVHRNGAAAPPTVTLIARHHPMKDFPNFLGALAILRAEGVALRAELVGEGCEAANPSLAAELDASGVRDAVTLSGRLDDVAPALARAAVVCSSSAWGEGFHNVLAEAALAGVPIVSTDVGDARVIVEDAACLVPPRDTRALASALRAVLTSPPDALKAQVESRRKSIAARFGVESMRDRYEALVRDVVHGR